MSKFKARARRHNRRNRPKLKTSALKFCHKSSDSHGRGEMLTKLQHYIIDDWTGGRGIGGVLFYIFGETRSCC